MDVFIRPPATSQSTIRKLRKLTLALTDQLRFPCRRGGDGDMVDAVTVCTLVPKRFERFLRPERTWHKHTKDTEVCYVVYGRHVRLEYKPVRGRLWASFNAPRILHGHNGALLHPTDWNEVVEIVSREIRETFFWIAPKLPDWTVSKIEYPVHYRVGRGEMAQWLRLLADMRMPYLAADTTYEPDGTMYQENQSRQLIAYDKRKQLVERYDVDLPELADVLRLEMRYQCTAAIERQMKKVLGAGSRATLRVATKPDWVAHIQRGLHELVLSVATAPTVTEAQHQMELAGWSPSKVRHHIEWMERLFMDGVTVTYQANRQSFYRRRRALASVGLPVLLSQGLSMPEELPSTISRTVAA